MPADAVITRDGAVTVPLDYVVPTGTEIVPRVVSASFDGSGAAGAYVPVLEVIAPNGSVTAYCARQVQIAAGASVLVSWFPGVAEADQASSSTPAGSVDSVTSPAGTLAVTSPSGPDVQVDMPASGVAAGTYGDATDVPRITVDAEGRLTDASVVPISGLSGTGLLKLFDSTLGAPAASIDTGANAIAAGHGLLFIFIYARTDRAAATDNLTILFNNDSAAHYDDQRIVAGAGTALASATHTAITTLGQGVNVPSATAPANTFGYAKVEVPSYDSTAGFKPVYMIAANAQNSATNSTLEVYAAEWQSTAAINRVAIASVTGANLIAGSRMQIYGVQ